MRIVVAPQELKGSLTAIEAAAAMAAGARAGLPSVEVDQIPMADGGPGTVAAVVAGAGGTLCTAQCRDPLSRPIEASFGLIDAGRTAIIEMAAAAGILRLRPEEYDPLRTGTEGVGDLIQVALDAGVTRIIVGLGGSATNDGGAGMARALGVRLHDAAGADLPPGGAALQHLHRIDLSQLDRRLAGVTISAATDVRNPLSGPTGASAVFGPQKGASLANVAQLDAALRHYARIIREQVGPDVIDTPGAGAAGGLGAGLLAFLNAELQSGFELVAAATRLRERIATADLVVTGEGQLDGQSLFGKTSIGVAGIAAACDVPCVAICGSLGEGWSGALERGLTAAFSLAPGPITLAQAQQQAHDLLAATAAQVVRLFAARR